MTTDHRNNPLIMPMFVYGTLLPGHYNHELVEDDYVHVDQGVVIAGQLFWAHTEGSYPVAKVDLPGRIVGAILWINILSNGFYHASLMEQGAGYEARWVAADVNEGARTEKVMVWHYLHHPSGDRIQSGDWAAAVRRR